MTELHHFHPARKGSGSLRPFPIYPLYTQAEILSLDKPIADCFLFRPRKSREKRRKRSHTNVSNTLLTRTSIPPVQTTHVRFRGRKRVHTPPQPLTAHTAAYTAKQGAFWMGRYHYPRSVLRGSETLRGRVSERRTLPLSDLGRGESRRTQRACGTAMRSLRVAVPRRRGPAGLRDPVAVPLTALIGFTILLSRIVAHRKLSACSLVTAVRFWNRCSRRSMRGTCPLEQRSDCRF